MDQPELSSVCIKDNFFQRRSCSLTRTCRNTHCCFTKDKFCINSTRKDFSTLNVLPDNRIKSTLTKPVTDTEIKGTATILGAKLQFTIILKELYPTWIVKHNTLNQE